MSRLPGFPYKQFQITGKMLKNPLSELSFLSVVMRMGGFCCRKLSLRHLESCQILFIGDVFY